MLLWKSVPQFAQEFGTFAGRTKIAVRRMEGALRDRHLSRIHLFPSAVCRPLHHRGDASNERSVSVPCSGLPVMCAILNSQPPARSVI